MQKKLELITKGLIAATFFVPLVVIPSSFIFPFIVPKVVLFRSIVLLMLGSYLILLASRRDTYKIHITPITIGVGIFFTSFLLSTFFGVEWYSSFWDNHERMLGLFTLAHYVLYYLVITSLVRGWSEWKWLLRAFLFAGSLVMLVGVWQKLVNPDFLLNMGSERVSATLGNAIYYSAYGLFLFFVGVLLVLKEKRASAWFWYAALGALLGFAGIFFGGTRGTVLALIAGLGVVCLSYVILLNDRPKIRKTLTGILAGGVILFLLLFAFRQTSFVRNIPTFGSLLNSQISGGTASTRIMAWGIAVDAWQERPLFGWGPNNFFYAFNKYYRPEFLRHGYGETWFDNAHNIIMNTLAVQGIVGILAYVGLFWVAIHMLWKRRKTMDRHVVAIGTAFLVAHFVGNIFVFENPTSYMYFFFFLAFLNQMSEPEPAPKDADSSKKVSTVPAVAVTVFVLLIIFMTNVQPARANRATFRSLRDAFSGQIGLEAAYEKATSIPTPYIGDIRSDFARNLLPVIPQYAKAGKTDEAIRLAELLYAELEKNKMLHPLDIRNYMYQAQISQTEAEFNQIPDLLFRAEQNLEEAIRYSPKRQQLQYMLATIKLQVVKYDEAVMILEESIANDPIIPEGWWRLAAVYQNIGNTEKAKEVILTAEERGVSFTGKGAEIRATIMGVGGE